MSTPRFDLVDITQTLRQRRKFIITVTIVALALGALFHLIRKKRFEGKSEFLVSNPLYGDRVNMFGAANNKLDYFGDEDDLDKVVALAVSDTVNMAVIKAQGLDTAYKLDMSDPIQLSKLKDFYKKYMDIKRTENKTMELTYLDVNPVRAARVANEAVKQLEYAYRTFYNSKRNAAYLSLQAKAVQEDSIINSLTDTLARLREESQIYDIISPNRDNIMNGTVKGAGGKNLGRNIEVIQNYESIKDITVGDRAKIASLMAQYTTGTSADQMPLFHVMTSAKPDVDPKGPTVLVVMISAFLVGLFFSCLYVLISAYYGELIAVQR